MAVVTANFETGVSGNTLNASDAGSATQFFNVTGSPKYSNAQVQRGSLSMKCDAPTAITRFQWFTGAWGTRSTTWYGRAYLYLDTAYTISNVRIIEWFGGSVACNLELRADQKLVLHAAGSTLTSAAAISLATWYRIEWVFNPSATVGNGSISYYVGDSATLIETLTTGNANNGTSTTGAGYGVVALGATTGIHYLDQIADKADAQVFPFPVNSVAPTVSGLTVVGSTLTATTGTWNGTFTYTYQWTRNGGNIGGATSSTYATVGADVGTAVGCTVTATGPVVTTEAASQASSNTITVTAAASGGPGYRFGFL